jgi:hypothetical protein
MQRRPWHDLRWHWPSDQPDQIRFPKGPIRRLALPEYVAASATAVAALPLVAAAWTQSAARRVDPPSADFLGVAANCSFDPVRDREQLELLRTLGARRVLIRAPVWERRRLDQLAAFAAQVTAITGNPVVVAILQNRASIAEPRRWRADLASIFSALGPHAEAFQVIQAPNRTKWGCYHSGDALDLLEHAERVRRRFPTVRLAGPGVIDFEPAPLLRLLFNRRRFTLDIATALLYVDRRGAPENTQYGIFDLANKVRFTAAACRASPRIARGAPLWLTEINWPLLGTDIWTPTSDEECVDEGTAADFLEHSYRLAWATGQCARMYWWQLTAPGYGLVDARDGLRPRPAYHRLQSLLRAVT